MFTYVYNKRCHTPLTPSWLCRSNTKPLLPRLWPDKILSCVLKMQDTVFKIVSCTTLVSSSYLVGEQLNPVYTIQPVVKPAVRSTRLSNRLSQPVWQPVGCLFTRYSRLSNRLYNRLYRVNGVLESSWHNASLSIRAMCPNMERRSDWIIDVRLPRADTMALNSIEFSNWIKRKSINTTEEKAE